MDIRINPFVPQGEVRAIASKSQAHRALVCAALADKPTRIVLSGFSRDIQSTVDCLAALGAGIRRTDDGLLITPIKETTEDRALLECGESGTTLRFMLPLAGALGKNARLIGHGRLPQRPIDELMTA
jgi:3-phosphoshikimate 1-carboxyvinyltransferase